jgi:hypothetical protein
VLPVTATPFERIVPKEAGVWKTPHAEAVARPSRLVAVSNSVPANSARLSA